MDIVEGFLATARRRPHDVAVVDNAREITYAELADRARRVAARLLEVGDVGTVGVLTTRSAHTVVGLLGVLAAGGAYCPIDPAFPEERRRAMAETAGCRAVIGPDLDSAASGDVPAEDSPPVPVDGSRPAYVLFTSGSTGTPKPVVTPRAAIGAAVGSLTAVMGVGPGDRVLQFASLNWDTSFEEILPALTAGATLVFDDDAYSGSFRRFLRVVERHRITVLDLPTAFWHEFVHHLTDEGEALPASLRTVVIGGEAARPARLADWRALPGADGVRLVNTYGCTETTLVTHAVDLHGPLARPSGEDVVPIGRALPHVREHIGEDGELLIGGPALALGYLGLPEATEERFTTSGGPAGRYFHTRDRVRRDADGVLVHLGRLDDEIKIRGVRVGPGEVEAQLSGHPGVAAVAATGHSVGDHTALVAYVVPRPGADHAALAADLLAHLRTHSPRHLVPSRITVVPELPRTASGKVDRRRAHQLYANGNRTKEAGRAH